MREFDREDLFTGRLLLVGDASSLKNISLTLKPFLCCNSMCNRQHELLFLESNQTWIPFVFSVGWETRMPNWPLTSA